MILKGYILAIIELFLFYKISSFLRIDSHNLDRISPISYYWIAFTILTGTWEFFYVLNRPRVHRSANKLLRQKTHVWTNNYNLKFLLPQNFSRYFYAEYGAYADREYITSRDPWSLIIESTHAVFCGLNCFLGLYTLYINELHASLIFMSVAMSSQLMNSILYMSEYLIQINDRNSVNYDTKEFPTGYALCYRPFMYINVLWTVMPMYVLYSLLN